MPNIITVYDRKRGCGFRKPGGIYLMGDESEFDECDLLPIPLDVPCVCCGNGVVAQKVEKNGTITYLLPRSLHRVNIRMLAEPYFGRCDKKTCAFCPFKKTEWAYLIGVGSKFYATKGDFIRETIEQGISKRIAQLPLDFKVGESRVALAHSRGVLRQGGLSGEPIYQTEEPEELPLMTVTDSGALVSNPVRYAPAIFGIFRPTRVEYVVSGNEDEKTLERLEKRGITLVHVERIQEVQMDFDFADTMERVTHDGPDDDGFPF